MAKLNVKDIIKVKYWDMEDDDDILRIDKISKNRIRVTSLLSNTRIHFDKSELDYSSEFCVLDKPFKKLNNFNEKNIKILYGRK